MEPVDPPAAPAWERWTLYALAGIAAIAGLAGRLWLGRDLPLWVDESWTVMVATQPDWAGVWREAWRDANAPLYYLLTALWTPVAGVSDFALRLPSLVFAMLAGLLPILWRAPGLSLSARLAWGAMLWLWAGGLGFAADARVYALLLLLATAQSIAFVGLLAAPERREALVWASLATFAGLAHYFALFLTLAQGVLLLFALGPTRTLRLWPACFAFLPLATLPAIRDELQARNAYSLEPASAWLARSRPERVALLWDHPNMAIVDNGSLRPVGNFFLQSAGLGVESVVIRVPSNGDPPAVLSGAEGAILWLYDPNYRPGTEAALRRLGAERRCRLFPRAEGRGVLACLPVQ